MASQHEQSRGKRTAHGTSLAMWRQNKKPAVRLSWGDLDPAILQRAISAVTGGGGAIMFGVTSDGGAFSVCVLYKEEKLKDYPNSVESAEQLLSDLADQFSDWTPAA